jgi:hypothetical protein
MCSLRSGVAACGHDVRRFSKIVPGSKTNQQIRGLARKKVFFISFNFKNYMNKKIKDQIVIYTGKDGKIELHADVEKETLWTTQAQISRLFGVNIPTINEHLKNIFKTNELKKISTIRNFRIVQDESGRKVKRNMNFYNLDVIIAVGYRVNSKKATKFRIWATSILRDYLARGFNLNRRKLISSEEKFKNIHEAIDFIESKSDKPLKAKVIVRLTKDLTP